MASIDDLLTRATALVNAAHRDSTEERVAASYRRGILDAAEALGLSVGLLLIEQDQRQMAAGRGEELPMCGGVWLDK